MPAFHGSFAAQGNFATSEFAELAESAKHSSGSAFAEGDFGCGPATAGVWGRRKPPQNAALVGLGVGGVADDGAVIEVDDVFADVGGAVCDAFDGVRNGGDIVGVGGKAVILF